jgi:tryptophanase
MWRGQVLLDPRYTAAVRRWAACMHDAGYPYADPATAHAAFLDPVRPLPGQAEQRTATAEASCAVRTGLGDAARRLETGYRDALLDRYRSQVITERQLVLAAIPRALHHTERDHA